MRKSSRRQSLRKPNPVRSRKDTERAIQKTILDWLGAEGYLHWRNNSGMARSLSGRGMIKLSPEGSPDIYYVRPPNGKLVGLEVKKPPPKKTYLRPDQKDYRDKMVSNGCEYHVVRSLDEAKKAVIDGTGNAS